MGRRSASEQSTICRLAKADVGSYRKLRLEALRREPEAFSAAWEDEAAWPLANFASCLESNAVFSARVGESAGLAGMIGFRLQTSSKLRHKGVIWGLYVRPQSRGRKLGTALIAAVLDHAAATVEELRLTVGASNLTAICLYTRAGFQRYGVEPRALKIGDAYHDEVLMARRTDNSGPSAACTRSRGRVTQC